MFYTVMCWHKLGEVKRVFILRNSIVLFIVLPKIIKVSESLTELWQKKFWLFFIETRCNTIQQYNTIENLHSKTDK